MLHRIVSLIIKELFVILGDVRSRTVIIVPPLIQILVFGYAATYDIDRIPYAVLNEDQGQVSRELLARFEGSDAFELVTQIDNISNFPELIESRRVLMLVHIRSEFSRELAQGRPGNVQLIFDGRNSNTAMIAANDAAEIVSRFGAEVVGAAPGTNAVLIDRVWYNPNMLSRWFVVPGIVGLLTMVVTTMVTSLSVARERELGTFDQLLVTPMRTWEIVIGKAIPPFLIGMVEAGFIVTVAVLWFGVPLRGELITLFAGVACFLLSAIGVGLAISSIARTMQQGLLGAFMFLVPSVILSGFATPIANMPELVRYLTLLNPLRYFMVVLRGVFLEGATLASLSDQLWTMLLIGVVSFGTAQWLFRRQLS